MPSPLAISSAYRLQQASFAEDSHRLAELQKDGVPHIVKLKELLLLSIAVITAVGFYFLYDLPTRAQQTPYVCAKTRTCSTGFPEDCFPAPTTLPTIDVHQSGDWYSEDLNGHCGAREAFFGLSAEPCGPPRGVRLCMQHEKNGA